MNRNNKIYEIPLSQIRVSEFNVRKHDPQAEIEFLAKSIRDRGLLQPVVLRGTHGVRPYELIVGQRRFLAHKKLGRRSIKAVFCGSVTDLSAKILSLAENLHRVELNHADKAQAITALYNRYKRNDRRVAKELGLPIRTVRDYIKIEERASRKAKGLLRERKVSKADVKRAIDAAHGDKDKADDLLSEMRKLKLTKYEKTRIVNLGRSHPRASAKTILEEAMKPKIERTLILNLTDEVEKALNRAQKDLLLEKEQIAEQALTLWLRKNRYLT